MLIINTTCSLNNLYTFSLIYNVELIIVNCQINKCTLKYCQLKLFCNQVNNYLIILR